MPSSILSAVIEDLLIHKPFTLNLEYYVSLNNKNDFGCFIQERKIQLIELFL